VEDSPILAATLERFLRGQNDISIAGIAPSAEDALKELKHLVVDLVLVDVALPGISGIDLVALLRKEYPGLKCLMLSGHIEVDYVNRALAAGAYGYAVKSDPFGILEGIQRVLEGQIYLSKGLQRGLLN